jgi:hypothetical protein
MSVTGLRPGESVERRVFYRYRDASNAPLEVAQTPEDVVVNIRPFGPNTKLILLAIRAAPGTHGGRKGLVA